MEDKILDLKNWTRVENDWCGIYRYVIAAKVAYEIIVEYHYLDTPIETAKASLYLVGLWREKDNKTLLEREKLGESLPIQELLEIAQKDNKENNQ